MDARGLYTERLAAREAASARLRSTERRIAITRLALLAAAIAIAFVAFGWLIAVPVVAFVALVFVHDRIIERRKRIDAAAAFYRRGLQRLDGGWPGEGVSGQRFETEHHPFASDIDLFGVGSLYELLCLAVSSGGQEMLARWLATPSTDAAVITGRQQAMAELRDDVDFRETMSSVAHSTVSDVEHGNLGSWSQQHPFLFAAWERVAALALPAIAVALVLSTLPSLARKLVGTTHPEFGVQSTSGIPVAALIVVLIVQSLLARRLSDRVGAIISGVERAEPALAQLQHLLVEIERREFRSERLQAVAATVRQENGSASSEIDRLRRLVGLLDARRNQFFAPIGLLLMWTTNVAMRIERWRQKSGRQITAWMDAVAEIEALSSISSFAFENPGYATPEIVTGRQFAAVALGHPLIKADRRITNDVRLGEDMRLLLVSGSNMSGKSTLLRSVGVASVLALTGAPVCARSLRISPLAIGASIRINDSLQEGASRFYAEILRIRQILELAAGDRPLLFLLDEILHGTNSHDRRIGAEAVVRRLVADGAIGLVSTHDLALARIAESLAPKAANVHFEDHLEDGKMVFDYKMRPGVVEKSNALALMRSVGIDV
jgi:hypothetical protein